MSHVTPNMNLTGWNLITDTFNHTELDDNWTAIDNHDHSTGKGTQIPEDGIGSLAVTNGKIATNAVDARTITADAVTSSELRDDASVDANRAVTTDHIRDQNVTFAKLADDTKHIAARSYFSVSDATFSSTFGTGAGEFTLTDGSTLLETSFVVPGPGILYGELVVAFQNAEATWRRIQARIDFNGDADTLGFTSSPWSVVNNISTVGQPWTTTVSMLANFENKSDGDTIHCRARAAAQTGTQWTYALGPSYLRMHIWWLPRNV